VGNTWIVDLRDFLTPDGTIIDFPGRARAEYFASIVVDATANIDDIPGVQCRRRARHQRCAGIVFSYLCADKEESIRWYCPVCGDDGIISGWRNTRWDRLAPSTPTPSAGLTRSHGS
jgi:hypothetical protein